MARWDSHPSVFGQGPNQGPFSLSLANWCQSAQAKIDGTVRQTIINFATKLIDRSPYGQPETWKRPAPKGYSPGAFKANWQLGVDTVPSGTLMLVDPTGAVTKARIASQIPAQAAGHIFTLANNLPYAWRLEVDGWSHQAPFGFAGVTVTEFSLILSQSAAEAKAGRVADLVSA